MKTKVLFVCIHNSARSQMAEAFLNQLCGDEFEAQSAGIESGKLNPVVVAAMAEIGFDISGNKTKTVEEMIQSGQRFSHVITVCDETSAERCPVYPGVTTRLHWSFPDPSGFQGTGEDRLNKTREVRDAIQKRIRAWCSEVCRETACC
ncbi:MAG TPA: arsenate reductase ArsC [Verrucomicrobiae bacterium]|nr:arsenate reductase ArsC [Verrucomicrobiae bacterium]